MGEEAASRVVGTTPIARHQATQSRLQVLRTVRQVPAPVSYCLADGAPVPEVFRGAAKLIPCVVYPGFLPRSCPGLRPRPIRP